MSDESESLRIARGRIAKEMEERTGFLDLGMLGLQSWPAELWQLEHLTGLNLGEFWCENDEVILPLSIGGANQLEPQEARWNFLRHLTQLHINQTAWTDLNSLSGLTRLQILECSGNRLTTLSGLRNLRSLRFIDCSHNQLASLEGLAGINSLKSVNCSGNRIDTLATLPELPFLQDLHCSSNRLTNLSGLPNLRSLRFIDCSHNQLSSLDGLAGITSLESLNCSGNRIDTLDGVKGLPSLQRLNCSRNSIASLKGLANLPQLQILDCSINRITTLEGVAELPALQILDCSVNQFTTLEDLAGMESLQELNCTGNELKTLKGLTRLPSLRFLNCRANQLATLKELTALPLLHALECPYNCLTSLEGLEGITSLQSLDCSHNCLTSLEGLEKIKSLQSLQCSHNQLIGLAELAGLSSLRSIDCYDNQIGTLHGMTGLDSLHHFHCASNRLTSLDGIASLTSLQIFFCNCNQLATLKGLSGLASLKEFYCPLNQLETLEGLVELPSLQSFDCSSNQLITLEGVSSIATLQALHCSSNKLATLHGVEGLRLLHTLNCSGNQITSLLELTGLVFLRSLQCSDNQLKNLEGLAGLNCLQLIHCCNNPIKKLPAEVIWHPLRKLVIFKTDIRDIPAELLSQDDDEDCLERLRAHFEDLEAGEELLPDVKVIVLGNGRTGKTQICNRLRGLPFEQDADSTHGVTVATQEFGRDTRLRLWDFGGQDIYHGTHALFMRSRAVFVLVWTPESETSETHQHGGMTFRNRHLAWWLSYVRHLAGPESPVLLVQNRCDRPEDRRLIPPAAPEELEAFSFHHILHYSALNQRGKAALEEALKEAVEWLREKQGQARIGTGRLAVKNRLEALLAEDTAIADSSQRRHRTLSMEQYEEICEGFDSVSSPKLLLEYLHLSGVVFHQSGLFGNCIILDQGWVLEAVYTVFNRDRCFRQFKQLHGRMTRTLLEALVWQDYTKEEQQLFLGFMLSCGICFIHRHGDDSLDIETEYIAPDLLPEYAAVAHDLEARWDGPPFEEAVLELPFDHVGVIRTLLSRIGGRAGMTAIYWRDGVYLYESIHKSHARIEQRLEESPPRIVIHTHGGESLSLLEALAQWAREAAEQSGLREVRVRFTETIKGQNRTATETGVPDRQPSLALKFDAVPSSQPTYAVSYSWKEDSRETVERLCREAESKGVRIMRDTTNAGMGERLSRFMTLLASQDRVFVILSDAYLRSESCMFELSEIWRLSLQDDTQFHERVRVFRLPDARIYDLEYRLDIIEYWNQRQKSVQARLAALAGEGVLSTAILQQFDNLTAFARHAAEIVPSIADRLLPRDFDEFVRHGFIFLSTPPHVETEHKTGWQGRIPGPIIGYTPDLPPDHSAQILMPHKVFLSHNSADKPEVEALALRLSREHGIEPWLDKWNLIPGQPWQEEIEDAMRECDCCAVFIGKGDPRHGVLGPWQNAEMRALISRQVTERGSRFAVIPVLLPGAERGQLGKLPTFLVANTWVEFHGSLDDPAAFSRLLAGIRRERPGPPGGGAAHGPQPAPAIPASQPPPRIPAGEKRKILFLAANPTNETRLALDVECREIEARIRAAEHRDLVEMHTGFAVRPADLLQYLQQHTPHIVHFSGHGSAAEEIILLGPDGKARPVSVAAITHLFKTFQDNIRVVVLNACYSRAQAEAVTSVIDCAVGMRQAIGDEAAITFAAAFYQAIAFGRSVQTAFDAGKTAIMLEGIPEEDTPELLTRAGVDASRIFLARPNP